MGSHSPRLWFERRMVPQEKSARRSGAARGGILTVVVALAALPSGCGGGSQSGESADDFEPAVAVRFEEGDSHVRVLLGGQPFTALHFGDEWDKPFLHPLATPAGLTVSRGYPLDPRPGEERDHAWHRGIWYGHGDINGHDFWRELGRDRTATIVPLSKAVFELGPARGSLQLLCGLRTANGILIGSLDQRFTVYRTEDANRIDARLRFVADRGRDLRFGDTEDGGFAMRLADGFRQEHGAVLLNSGGLRDTENIWGRPARWVAYSGMVDGRPAAVTILDHPSNPRHPSRWHARGYSLCSANPFGLRDFTGDESVDGSHVVAQGGELVLRYRVILQDGLAEPTVVERWFEEFAADSSP